MKFYDLKFEIEHISDGEFSVYFNNWYSTIVYHVGSDVEIVYIDEDEYGTIFVEEQRDSISEKMQEVYNLSFQYAITPISQRAGQNKYYLTLSLRGVLTALDSYLNYNTLDEIYSLGTAEEASFSKTKFTKEEILNIGEKIDISNFQSMEVK